MSIQVRVIKSDLSIVLSVQVEIKGTIIPDRETGRKTVFVSSNQTSDTEDPHFLLSSVEELALSHYCRNEGWERGLHAEGSSFSALFCLLLWDVIFTSGVPNVFRTKYQVTVERNVN